MGTTVLLTLAGCSGSKTRPNAGITDQQPSASPATDTERETTTHSPTEESPVGEHLQTARLELGVAFTEIHSVDLVNYEEKVWTPRYRDLGNMDREAVLQHVAAARSALSDAEQLTDQESESRIGVELLRHVASIAEQGAEFYYLFALTFEKVYQYEYLIDVREEYEKAVEKMGIARETLARWSPVAEKLATELQAIKHLYDEYDTIEADVESFDVEHWNYTAFGAGEYPRLLEPRFVGFEAYAEAVGADLAGLDHLDASEYTRAQQAFQTARSKIQQAGIQFSEATSRGDSFFESRALSYENRVQLFDEGYLLHLRATNEFVRGHTENAKQLRFEGTTKIRNAFSKYPLGESGDTTTRESR